MKFMPALKLSDGSLPAILHELQTDGARRVEIHRFRGLGGGVHGHRQAPLLGPYNVVSLQSSMGTSTGKGSIKSFEGLESRREEIGISLEKFISQLSLDPLLSFSRISMSYLSENFRSTPLNVFFFVFSPSLTVFLIYLLAPYFLFMFQSSAFFFICGYFHILYLS